MTFRITDDFRIKHENELVGELKKADFEACRVPGPLKIKPDILAGNEETLFVIDVKITAKNIIIIRSEQIKNLMFFAWKFKAEAWVAVKFINQTSWIFIKPNTFKISTYNQKLCIDYNTAQQKGVNLRELVNSELKRNLIN